MIDLEFIEKLIRTLDDSGLDHVEIERGGTRVRVSRSAPVQSVGRAGEAPGPAGAPVPPPTPSSPVEGSAPTSGSAPGEASAANDLHEIKSPMVGTFYRSPSPDADPFTELGREISLGDTLCIIEAMKLMNELEAETGGVVREICVDDGEPVEYGQVLFRVQVG